MQEAEKLLEDRRTEIARLSQLSQPKLRRTAIVIALVIGLLVGYRLGGGNRLPHYHSVGTGLVLDTATGLYCSPYPHEDVLGFPPGSVAVRRLRTLVGVLL